MLTRTRTRDVRPMSSYPSLNCALTTLLVYVVHHEFVTYNAIIQVDAIDNHEPTCTVLSYIKYVLVVPLALHPE
jgi:hypothetical protein